MTMPNAVLAEKNKLSQSGAWPWLLDLTPYGSTTTYHYTSNTAAVVYQSITYTPMPFRIQPIEKSSDGQLTVMQIILSDVGLALQSIIRNNSGLRKATVTLTQVNTALLAQDYSSDALTYQISHCQNQYTDVVFYCGVPGSLRQRVPEDAYLALQCRHDFRVPRGPFQNLVATSETFAGWNNYFSGPTLTDNTNEVTAPNGMQTASKWVTPGGGSQGKVATGASQTAGAAYTVSVWMKGAVGGEVVHLAVCDGNGANKTLTTSWVRYTYTVTSRAGIQLERILAITCANAATFYVWGAQAEEGTAAGLYFKTSGTARNPKEGDYSSRCGYVGKTITGVTLPGNNPVIIAATAHGFVTGDVVRIYGVTQIANLDGDYLITKIDADNFRLDGTDGNDFTGTWTIGGKAGYAKCPRILTQCRNLVRSSSYGGIAAMRADAVRLAL